MDQQNERNLWEELRLLQPIIDKCENFTFQIRNWFITLFVAVSGYAVAQTKPSVLLLNLFALFAFYFYEVSYRTAHAAFLQRGREIQALLRAENNPEPDKKGPYFDKYLYPMTEAQTNSKLFKFFLNVGIPEERAKEDEVATRAILKECWNMLFQLRVSGIYIAALLVNIIIAFWL